MEKSFGDDSVDGLSIGPTIFDRLRCGIYKVKSEMASAKRISAAWRERLLCQSNFLVFLWRGK